MNSRPSPNLIPGSWICPPRFSEAIRAVSGLHRRGLESGVCLFTPNISRPDARVLDRGGKRGKLLLQRARGQGTREEMPNQGPVSDWTECSSSAEPPAVARAEGGGGGSAGHSYYQNSKGTDRIKDGHKVNSPRAKLQELWKMPQTVHTPKSMTEPFFLKHPDFTLVEKRYLCSIAKIYNANYLRTLMKRHYMHVIQRSSQKPGRCTSSLKTGYASKTRCKSLKICRKPGRPFMQSVSANDSESYLNEEKKEEDLLNKCMQSMSIEEQGEHLMLT
ncbi:protein FAM216A isoform X3 [Bubalus bubalis]|uniref:protein FAM216A isoform X3 n=1 Tax=Bubalus bubalis TaxID=89462 RepID=UPI001E1B80A6|nr:protein FAM216A isoform X3 [Bubalus bubalis]